MSRRHPNGIAVLSLASFAATMARGGEVLYNGINLRRPGRRASHRSPRIFRLPVGAPDFTKTYDDAGAAAYQTAEAMGK